MRGMVENEELVRLKAEHRQVRDLLILIQQLTSTAVVSESAAELFSRSFPILASCLVFDVGVAVMLEQNLDLYVSTTEDAAPLVGDPLVASIRQTLETLIPVSFATTDVIVKAESHDVPASAGVEPGIAHQASTVITQGRRTAGIVLVYRGGEPFSEAEQQVLEIFSTQVSMLLDTIYARQRIANLADTDDLTGISNRRFLRRQLPQEVERAKTFNIPLTLILFDIDEFKQINDSFGHVIGDVVLSELCGVVREALRPTDTLARFGGDEFAVILPHTDREGAVAVAERLLSRVREVTIPTDDDGAIQCSISIGVAELHSGLENANDLIRAADEKLYDSKRQGKNRYTA
jgi:diguanylate cyclase (GGDEF)-like protein